MKSSNSRVRIKDIAEMAGVSEGTVDRVLHNRGDVSEKSRKAVTKVLKEINYTPNIYARSLASKKHYRFVCVFPDYKKGEYWEAVDQGFNRALQQFQHHNVEIEKKQFNQFDPDSLNHLADEIVESEPDAVFISPIFKEETIRFARLLENKSIPYSFIDSKINDLDYLTYYGQDSYKSGYIAAKLIISTLNKAGKILIIRTKRKGAVSNQTLTRNSGFLHYLHENKLEAKFELVYAEMANDDEEANLTTLDKVLKEHPDIVGAITFNSKVYRLAMHLATLNKSEVVLIGYDLLDENIHYLQKDVISYLIAQRPARQAFFTVEDMCKKLIFKQDTKKNNYVPIDILIKENIDDYKNFVE